MGSGLLELALLDLIGLAVVALAAWLIPQPRVP